MGGGPRAERAVILAVDGPLSVTAVAGARLLGLAAAGDVRAAAEDLDLSERQRAFARQLDAHVTTSSTLGIAEFAREVRRPRTE